MARDSSDSSWQHKQSSAATQNPSTSHAQKSKLQKHTSRKTEESLLHWNNVGLKDFRNLLQTFLERERLKFYFLYGRTGGKVLRMMCLGLRGVVSKCIAEKTEPKMRWITLFCSRLKKAYQLQLNKNRFTPLRHFAHILVWVFCFLKFVL